jgi:hypothetical protein
MTLIKTEVKKEMREVEVRKHHLDDAVAKEIALGLLADKLELTSYEVNHDYVDTDYSVWRKPIISSRTETVELLIRGYKVTIERG